jgi:hypothetical protein
VGSSDFDLDGVVSSCAVRHWWRDFGRLELSVRIGGSNGKGVRAGGGLPVVFPLPPGVRANCLRQLCRLPGALVDLHLDSQYPRVLGPGDSGDDNRPRIDGRFAWDIDP